MERRSERRKKIVKWIFLTPLCIAGFLLLGNFIILRTKLFDTIAFHIAEKYMLENYPEFKDYDPAYSKCFGIIHTIKGPLFIKISYKMDYVAVFRFSDNLHRSLQIHLPGYFPFQAESASIQDITDDIRKAKEDVERQKEELERQKWEKNRKKYWDFTEEPAS